MTAKSEAIWRINNVSVAKILANKRETFGWTKGTLATAIDLLSLIEDDFYLLDEQEKVKTATELLKNIPIEPTKIIGR